MNITKLKAGGDRQSVSKAVREMLTPDNYGSKSGDGWSITDLLHTDDQIGAEAFSMLSGRDSRGKPTNLHPKAKGMQFKLKVLTRQACYCDSDGGLICGNSPLRYNNQGIDYTIFPNATDKPVDGDVVRVKWEYIDVDPDTGKYIDSAAQKQNIEWRHGLGAVYQQLEYVVEDGCITVPFEIALHLLKKWGKKVVFPQHARKNSNLVGEEYAKQRVITNWRFEEVLPTAKVEKQPVEDKPKRSRSAAVEG